jgi:TP901 family phage tail tape measure protein
MARQVASLFGVLRLDDSDYQQKLGTAQRETRNLGQTLQTQGQNLQQVGAGMTAFFAPVGVAMGYAVNQAHTFDRMFSNVNSILQLGTQEAAALRAEILAYGAGTVAGPEATIAAFYEIVSGVTDATTHMAILDAATRTSEAGQADLAATTSAMISTMNAYSFSAEQASLVSDVFSRTVGMGVGTMDELAASFPQVLGLGAQFGQEVDDLGAGMAYLSTKGYTFSQGATYMRAMMTTLLNPTEDLATAITALGYESGAALLEAEGLTGAYELLAEHNGGLDGLITNTEALTGALALTDDGAQAFFDTYQEGLDGSTERAGAIQDQTEQWDLLKSALDGIAIQVGSALMPVLNDLVTNYIMPVVTAVSAWITANPELTTQIALFMAGLVALGPVIGMIGMAISAVTGVVMFLLSPIGLVIAAVALLAAAYYTNFGGIKDYIDTAIIPTIQGFIDKGIEIWTAIEPSLTSFYNWFMVDALPGIWSYMNDHIFPLITNFGGVFTDAWTVIEPILGLLYDWWMVTGLPFIEDDAQRAMQVIGGAFDIVGDKITEFITGVNDAVTAFREFINLGDGSNYGASQGAFVSEGGGFGAGVQPLPDGTRAGGGDVDEGRSYMVGENGPERFVPSVSGTIIPNGQSSGQTFQINVQNINANTYEGGRAAARGLEDEITEFMRGRGISLAGT